MVLTNGSRGEYVKALQIALNNTLGLALSTDGIYGRGTQDAVDEYSKVMGLGGKSLVDDAFLSKLGIDVPKPTKRLVDSYNTEGGEYKQDGVDKLSENFTLHEFLRSATAKRKGIDNSPDKPVHHINMKRVAALLEKIRAGMNAPVHVNSGYRNNALNKAVGGSVTSAHSHGAAADVRVKGYSTAEVCAWAEANLDSKEYDTILCEYLSSHGWLHLAVSKTPERANRGRVMTAYRKNGRGGVKYINGLHPELA